MKINFLEEERNEYNLTIYDLVPGVLYKAEGYNWLYIKPSDSLDILVDFYIGNTHNRTVETTSICEENSGMRFKAIGGKLTLEF